jgi:hypothetical protein
MNDEQRWVLEIFRKLDPENRANALAHIRVAYAAQEHTKRYYGLLSESDPAHGGAAQPTTKRETAGGKPAA